MATGTQEAPTTASKVEKSAIMAGEIGVLENVGNTDNTDAIPEELRADTDATSARIDFVANREPEEEEEDPEEGDGEPEEE